MKRLFSRALSYHGAMWFILGLIQCWIFAILFALASEYWLLFISLAMTAPIPLWLIYCVWRKLVDAEWRGWWDDD